MVQGTKPVREAGTVLERLELALRERIVVADVWTTDRLGYPQIGQRLRQRLGCHGCTPVGMQGQGVGVDALLGSGFPDEVLGQVSCLLAGHQPPDDVSTVDVEDDVQVEVSPL